MSGLVIEVASDTSTVRLQHNQAKDVCFGSTARARVGRRSLREPSRHSWPDSAGNTDHPWRQVISSGLGECCMSVESVNFSRGLTRGSTT